MRVAGFCVAVECRTPGCLQKLALASADICRFSTGLSRGCGHTNIDAQLAVFAAAQLSNKEMRRFCSGRSTEELVGAGTQAHLQDPLARALLAQAARQSPQAPMVWAALAHRDMSLLQNQQAVVGTIGDELSSAIQKWTSLEPNNAAPYYLNAAFQCLMTNVAAAKTLMAEADVRDPFETYSPAIQKCVIRAMESAGRSRFTARMYAMGQFAGVTAWSKLSKTILAESSAGEQDILSCFLLGQRVGRGKSFLEQLIGDSIESKAIDKMPGTDFADEKARIAERKARIKRATAYNNSLQARKVSEERWVRFLDTCFDKGEIIAVESLATELGETF